MREMDHRKQWHHTITTTFTQPRNHRAALALHEIDTDRDRDRQGETETDGHHPNSQKRNQRTTNPKHRAITAARNNAVSGVMWPLTAPCWVPLGSGGACGVGQWCSLDYDEEMGAVAWDVWLGGGRTRGSAYHQEGGADGLLMPSQESEWTNQGPCGQQGNNRWVMKR